MLGFALEGPRSERSYMLGFALVGLNPTYYTGEVASLENSTQPTAGSEDYYGLGFALAGLAGKKAREVPQPNLPLVICWVSPFKAQPNLLYFFRGVGWVELGVLSSDTQQRIRWVSS